jgi:hypothetical protein
MGEFGVVALLDERDNLSRPRTSSLALSELLKRWGRGGGLHNHGAGTGAGVAPGVGGNVVDGVCRGGESDDLSGRRKVGLRRICIPLRLAD